MTLNLVLQRQNLIVGPVEPILAHVVHRHAQEFVQRRAAVPRLGNMQFTRRMTEPRARQNGPDQRPGNRLTSAGQEPVQEDVELEHPPECQRQVDVAKATRALDMHTTYIDLDRCRYRFARVVPFEERIGCTSRA